MSDLNGMVDPKIFEDLQTKIDEDAEVRDQLKAILQTLERQCRNAQSVLSRAHSTPASHCKSSKAVCFKPRHLTCHSAACSCVCRECYKGRSWKYSKACEHCFKSSILQVCALESPTEHLTNKSRYNGIWTRDVQNVIFAILLCGWLGGLNKDGKPAQSGRLLTIEEVGEILQGTLHIGSLRTAQLTR